MISNLLSSNYKPKKTLSNNKINRNYYKNITKANPKIKPLSNVIKNTKTFNKKKINDIINNSNGIERLKKNFPTLFNEELKKKNNNNNYSKTIEQDKNINILENKNKNNKVVIKSTLTDIKDNKFKKNNHSSLFSNDKKKKKGWKRNSVSFFNANSLNIDKTDKNKYIFNKKNQTNLNIYNNINIDDNSENKIQNENDNSDKEDVKSQKEKKDEDEVYYSLLNNNI